MDSVVENLKSLRPAIEVEVAAIGGNWKCAVCIVETRRYSTQHVERGPGTALGKGHGSHRGRVRTKSAAIPIAEAVKTTFLIVKGFESFSLAPAQRITRNRTSQFSHQNAAPGRTPRRFSTNASGQKPVNDACTRFIPTKAASAANRD